MPRGIYPRKNARPIGTYERAQQELLSSFERNPELTLQMIESMSLDIKIHRLTDALAEAVMQRKNLDKKANGKT